MSKSVLIPIAHGSEETELVTIADILRRANIKVAIAGDTDIVTCSQGVKIIPDILLKNVGLDVVYDAVVLPGGLAGTQNLLNNIYLQDILQQHGKSNKLIGAICAAPTILAELRITPVGSKITGHPSIKNQLSQYSYSDDSIVVSDNFVTSRGLGTAIEFALKLVEILTDAGTVAAISESICWGEPEPINDNVRYKYVIKGHVQGVGFRYFVYHKAKTLGMVGYTRNMYDGSVEVIAEGGSAAIQTFHDYLKQGSQRSRVDSVKRYEESKNDKYSDFSVR
ncbi:MAG: acylphosphatase [Chlorobi bacterium]|nr:acylphosphatase [Chlorobiota bacterium]